MNLPVAEESMNAASLLELEEVALTVVHELGRTGVSLFEGARRSIEIKHDNSIVTEGDRAIESQARTLLSRLTPHFGFAGEEFGTLKRLDLLNRVDTNADAPRTAIQQLEPLFPFERDLNVAVDDLLNFETDTYWLLDPIDGTVNFSQYMPTWSTLLALIHKGRPVLGIVALPALDQVFVASAGNGSHYGKLSEPRTSFKPCVVRPTVSLDDACLNTAYPSAFRYRGIESWYTSILARPGMTTQHTDAFGYTRILTGHLDAMIDPIAASHDLAALQVLFSETPGAYFSSLHGHTNGNTYKKGSAIAACSSELGLGLLEHYWRHMAREASLGAIMLDPEPAEFFTRFDVHNDKIFGQHGEYREWSRAVEMAVAHFKLSHPDVLVEDVGVVGEMRQQLSQRLKNSEPEGPPCVIRREGIQIRAVVAGGTGLVTAVLPEQTPKVDLVAQAIDLAFLHSREQNLPSDCEILVERPRACGHFGTLAWGTMPNPAEFDTTSKAIAEQHQKATNSEILLRQTMLTQNVQHRFQLFLDGVQQTISTGATLMKVSITSLRGDEKRQAFRARFIPGLQPTATLATEHAAALKESCRESLELLDAKYAPEELQYDYLAIDADLLGLILHEALGHALEGDLIELGQSGLGKEGQLQPLAVAPKWMNVVVDGNLTNCGYSPVDYEGSPARRKTIVRKGQLVEAIHTRETAKRMNGVAEGAARAQSMLFPSLNRMTSIWIQAESLLPLPIPEGASLNESIPAETLKQVLVEQGFLAGNKRVAYLAGWTGGTASCSNLEFRADVRTLHLLSADKKPVLMRQANFTGIATACFQSAVAAFGPVLCRTFGTCGKDGQGVPTSDGGPMILLLANHPQVRIIGSGDSE